ncbi:MAG: tetratricopeptide repeat protein [Desulfobacteraceae bacterium]|nr:tetratricopeptide repeat protein [Desulfobacteraceae bacterium]
MGFLLKSMGKYDKAQPYYQKTLMIREKVLGKEHETTAYSLAGLRDCRTSGSI